MGSKKMNDLGVMKQCKRVMVTNVSQRLEDLWPTASVPIGPHTNAVMLQNVGATVIRLARGGRANVDGAPELPVGGTDVFNMEYPDMMNMEFWADEDCRMNVFLYEQR